MSPSSRASGVSLVAAGSASGHTCAALDAGDVRCWGRNSYGQLGDGTTTNRPTPVPVSGLDEVSKLALGKEHTCALDDGAVVCWGRNAEGQLGEGTTQSRSAPVAVSGLDSDVVDISAGFVHSCALTANGSVLCWGNNLHGQLGTGGVDGANHTTPSAVVGLGGTAIAVAAGDWHTCAILSSGAARCWGENIHSQLGNGQTGMNQPTPVTPTGLGGGVVAIAGGALHTCALLSNSDVRCWGANDDGQLGTGGFVSSAVPILVNAVPFEPAAIVVGASHTCAMSAAGEAACWGAGSSGQLGNGSTDDAGSPVSPFLSEAATSMAAGATYTCAATANDVWCWGGNVYGQLGDGSNSESSMPVVAGAKVAGTLTATGEPQIDSDGDGCGDAREGGPDERAGGMRDVENPWDFFDTPDATNMRDKSVAGTDFFRVLSRFGSSGDAMIDPLSMPPAAPAYHTAFDRGASSGPNAWNLTAADGSIAGTDFFAMLVQFGHSCA